MELVNKFRSYLLEDEFKINISREKVNIKNYDTIGQIDSNKMVIYYEKGTVSVIGKNLSLIKMLDDELLISGNVQKIELGWIYGF